MQNIKTNRINRKELIFDFKQNMGIDGLSIKYDASAPTIRKILIQEGLYTKKDRGYYQKRTNVPPDKYKNIKSNRIDRQGIVSDFKQKMDTEDLCVKYDASIYTIEKVLRQEGCEIVKKTRGEYKRSENSKSKRINNRKQLILDFNDGISIPKLAIKHGTSDYIIRKVLIEEGAPVKKLRKLTDEEIIETYHKTKQLEATRNLLNCASPRIIKVLEKHNIPRYTKLHRIEIGDEFGHLTVIDIGKIKRRSSGSTIKMLICKCGNCGSVREYTSNYLRREFVNDKNCGCLEIKLGDPFSHYNLMKNDSEYRMMKELESDMRSALSYIKKRQKRLKSILNKIELDKQRLQVGQKIHRWTILSNDTSPESRAIKNSDIITCRCKCGKEKSFAATNLHNSKSCGCYAIEKNTKSGLFGGENKKEKQLMYARWKNMKKRCLNILHEQYHNYGGRGITICDRWLEPDGKGYVNFCADMGERPYPQKLYSLDRIDNDGNYEPSNCRWATPKQQRNNQRGSGIKKKRITLWEANKNPTPF